MSSELTTPATATSRVSTRRDLRPRTTPSPAEADETATQADDPSEVREGDNDDHASQTQPNTVALPPPSNKRALTRETSRSFTASTTPARELTDVEKNNLKELGLANPNKATIAHYRKEAIGNDAILAGVFLDLRGEVEEVSSRLGDQVKIALRSVADMRLSGNMENLDVDLLRKLTAKAAELEKSVDQIVDAYEGAYDQLVDLNKAYSAQTGKVEKLQAHYIELDSRLQVIEGAASTAPPAPQTPPRVIRPLPRPAPRTPAPTQTLTASKAKSTTATASLSSPSVIPAVRRINTAGPSNPKRARGNEGLATTSRTNLVRLKLRYPQSNIKAAAMVLLRFLPPSMSSSIASVWATDDPLVISIRFRPSNFGSGHDAAARYVALFDIGPPDARLEGMDAELYEGGGSGATPVESSNTVEDDAFNALVPANRLDSLILPSSLRLDAQLPIIGSPRLDAHLSIDDTVTPSTEGEEHESGVSNMYDSVTFAYFP